MRSLNEFASAKLAELERANLRRRLVDTTRLDGIWALRNGRRVLSFSCNDYLNLSQHPAIKAAAIEALQRHGVGSGASRLVTGNHPLFAVLEARLARLKQTEAACVFGSGYLANMGIIPALIGASDLVLIDELAHACLWAGARLSRATVMPFHHSDLAHARALLDQHRARHGRALIATDGVFSMDGDLAPIAGLAALAECFDAWLMTDDAHGMGVVGNGRGSTFAASAMANGVDPAVPLQMGTLSKAIGAYGGYLCASTSVIELIHNRARSFVYSTGLPPAIVAAAIAAIDLIARDPAYAALPLAKAQAFTRRVGLPEAESPIVPLVVGDAETALEASRLLEAEGFLVIAIRPPTVPAGTARLRFAFTAQHPDDEIARLADIVRQRILTAPPQARAAPARGRQG
jgi:8-amino-7-oxononanoate synthase